MIYSRTAISVKSSASIGKLYQTYKTPIKESPNLTSFNHSKLRTRCNSVGKIYTSASRSKKLQASTAGKQTKKLEIQIIDYNQIESKVSKAFEDAIKDNSNSREISHSQQPRENHSGKQRRPHFQKVFQALEQINLNNFNATCKKISFNKPKKSLCNTDLNQVTSKQELELKLKRIIREYEVKNKELSRELKKFETLNIAKDLTNAVQHQKEQVETEKKSSSDNTKAQQKQTITFEQEQTLSAIFSKLSKFNLDSLSLPILQSNTLQSALAKQIVLEQQLRIIRSLINENNTPTIQQHIDALSSNKKIVVVSIQQEQYDPFLSERQAQLCKHYPQPSEQAKSHWLAKEFLQRFQACETHWNNNFTRSKISEMCNEQIIEGMRLNLRDFTRWMSIELKSNLRNRNLYHIFCRLRNSALESWIAKLASSVKQPVIIR